MPKFNDSENRAPFQPEGDYVFCVTEFEIGISNGQKTAGCEKYEVTLEIEGPGNQVFENMIDHESCSWKIDTFLKSAGVKLAKGEAFEFRKDTAERKGVRWVNPLGLRGHCRLIVEEYEKNGQKRKTNRVAVFYTDKPKLAARVIEKQEDDVPFA